MRRLSSAFLSAAILAAVAPCANAQVADFKPVTEDVLANPDPGDWLMLNRTFDQQRYSPLNQINKSNVGQLRMAWARGLPIGTQESTPIVYRGVMYLYAPGASIEAVDATNGDLIWEYKREYPQGVNGRAARNKNLGIYEDMIYFAAPDGVLLALDAKTGKLRWETKVDDGGQTAGGILVADGKVITNRTCKQGERANCFIAAHDAKTGKEAWKFFMTAAPGEPGGDTWGDMPVEQRAAGPWGLPGSYDPEAQDPLLGHRQSESLYAADASRPRRRACRSPRPPISTATRPSRSTSRPASSSGTTRSFLATTGMRTTTTSASSCAPASAPIPST